MARYTTEAFQPDGGFSVAGLPLLLAIMTAAGVAAGALASFLGQWVYIVGVYAGGMGFALFFAGLAGARLAKLRNVPLAYVIAFVTGVVPIVAMHYCDYLRARPGVGFVSFLNAQATVGVTLSGRGGGGFNLGYYGTWAYWLAEYLAVAVLAAIGLSVTVTDPFCTACDRWKKTRQLGTLNGRGGDLAALVLDGDVDQLAEFDPAPAGGDSAVEVAVCPACGEEGTVEVKLWQTTRNEKGGETRYEAAHVVYPGEALAEFEALFGQSRRRRGRKYLDE